MLLNNILIEAFDQEDPVGISGIEFSCQDPETAAAFFKQQFSTNWNKAVTEVLQENKQETESDNYNPATIIMKKDGFFVQLDVININYQDGDYCDNEHGNKALTDTLKKYKSAFSQDTFCGCIQYFWSDLQSGDVVKYPIYSSEKYANNVYDFVGQKLADIGNSDNEIWKWLNDYLEETDDFEEILNNFIVYKEWIKDYDNAVKLLLDLSDENGDEETHELLEKILAESNL